MRLIGVIASIVVALAFAGQAAGAVQVYPSSQTIAPSGPIAGGATSGRLNAALGEREGMWIVATDAKQVSATVDTSQLGAIREPLYWGHYVQFGSLARPDALLPWDGSARTAERPNQPIYVQFYVPYDTKPGLYKGSVTVTTDGTATVVPFTIQVFGVALPQPGNAAGNFLSAFLISPQGYLNKAAALYKFATHEQRIDANTKLFAFLASYRISPAGYGFGEPSSKSGYTSSDKWWLDSAGMMKRQLDAGRFPTMRIPISSNRTSASSRIAGVPYTEPETWCDYLKAARSFWEQNGWLANTVPYLYALDEPGAEGMKLVARQAKAVHECWPGSQSLVTGNPSTGNSFLWDGKDGDDVDIWVVYLQRFYGKYTNPPETKQGVSHARDNLKLIDSVRKRGASVWSYNYHARPGTPDYNASGLLSDPRVFLLWNALEGTEGTLYGDGLATYKTPNPLESVAEDGKRLLLYPGADGPIASARLEQIRDGIEDATILSMVRKKRGTAAVWSILGTVGLFSANAKGVQLACTIGCDLKSKTPYSWPAWSSDATTPARIEKAKVAALAAAS